HAQPHRGLRKHASPATLILLGAFLTAAAFGAFGDSTEFRATSGDALLRIEAPARIRNGQIVEMRIHVRGERPVDTLVVRSGADMWKDRTVNTLLPTATEEAMTEGSFEFTVGPLEAGADWMMKVSLQINPNLYGLRRGLVRVLDRDEELAS